MLCLVDSYFMYAPGVYNSQYPYSNKNLSNIFAASGLTSCSMNWWRAPGSWSKQHRRRSTSGGGCRASSILHRNCIYIQNQKSSEAHRTCPCGNWTDLFCSLAVSSEYFQRFMRYAARYSLPVWCSERITFSAMCWDATPCDGDGRLGFEISPTTSPSTPLCASGERYFLYRNISNIWPGLYFFFNLRPCVDWSRHWFSILSTRPCCYLSLI